MRYAGLGVVFRTKPCEPEDLIELVKASLVDPGYQVSAGILLHPGRKDTKLLKCLFSEVFVFYSLWR